MLWFDMLFEVSFCIGFITTLVTVIIYTFMPWFYMIFKTLFLLGFITTLFATITYTFMIWFYMQFKKVFLCCPVATTITIIEYTLMLWFYMLFNIIFWGCLVFTFNTVMVTFHWLITLCHRSDDICSFSIFKYNFLLMCLIVQPDKISSLQYMKILFCWYTIMSCNWKW